MDERAELAEHAIEQVRADTADAGLEVGERAWHCGAHFGGHGARCGRCGIAEGLEVDFAFRRHLAHFVGGDAELVGERLPDWQSSIGELVDVVGVGFAGGGDFVEDRAGFFHGSAGGGGYVGDAFEHRFELFAGFDACGHGRCGDCRRLAESEAGAFDAGGRVGHDSVDAFRVVAEASEFGRGGVYGVESAESCCERGADAGDADCDGSGGDAFDCVADAFERVADRSHGA